DRAYYLAPAGGGEKVYELLKRAMEESGRVAVARVAIRSKVTLAVLRVAGGALSMSTMFYPDEVRDAGAIDEMHYHVELSDREVEMALNLVNSLTAHFEPRKYTDEYRQALLELIRDRVAGRQVAEPVRPEAARVVDLMEALKASIEKAKKERGQAVGEVPGEGEQEPQKDRRRGRRKAAGEG
ncbi:MAG: Ku protein, partial [Desulfofundulus sp.]